MRKWYLWLIPAATTAALLAGACGGDDSTSSSPTAAAPATTAGSPTTAATATTAAAPTDVVALKKSPASLAADDAAWKDARVTTVKTTVIKGSAATAPQDVKMQALYSDTDIWFRFEWADATKNLKGGWTYDGTSWKATTGQQDRIALLWEVSPSADFESKGCAALCHNPADAKSDKWYMVSPPGSTMDLWQWHAGESNGANQLRDQTLSNKVPEPTALGAPRVSDANTGGGPAANTNDAKNGPKMMQDPAKKPSMGTDYLLVSEAVALDVSKLKAGDKVPGQLISPYTGSQGDIQAKGAWANGTWTVVAHRKLDTGNPDDAKFTVGKSFKFALGAFNALADLEHTVTTEPYTLVLK